MASIILSVGRSVGFPLFYMNAFCVCDVSGSIPSLVYLSVRVSACASVDLPIACVKRELEKRVILTVYVRCHIMQHLFLHNTCIL